MQDHRKHISFLFLFMFVTGFAKAQDCDFPLPPANTCAEAPLLCNLDGYCSNNGNALNSGTPNAFCGIVENNNWVKFIAGSESFEIEITTDNCQNNAGLQAQFFQTDDCLNFTSVSNCLDPVNGTAYLTASGLFIGEIYYLMMDGKGGDVCDYSYVVTQGIILSPAEAVIDSAGYLCEGETLILDGSDSASGSGITYQWSTLDGNILSGTNTPQIEIDAPGTYQILVTDTGGCVDSAEIQIAESPLAIVEIEEPDTLDCLVNQTVTLTGSDAGGGPVDFLWTTPNGHIVSGETTPHPVVDMPGIYTLTLTNSITGCSASSFVEVFTDVNTPVAMAAVSDELNCINEEVELIGTGSSTGSNFAYRWTTPDGNILNGETELIALVNAPGIYFLEVTNLENDCVSTDMVQVIENPEEPEGAIIHVMHPCFGETDGSIEIEAVLGGISPYIYQFDSLYLGPENVLGGLPPAAYAINIQDETGCEWDTTIHVELQPELIVDLGDNLRTQLGCEQELEAQINFPLERIDSIIWSPGSDCFLCPELTVNPLETTLYSVLVIDRNGCEAHDEITLQVEKERLVFIPNVFTPNFDGTNDLLMIHGGKGIKQVNRFSIFNRWGAEVFSQSNFLPNDPEHAWDGRFKGSISENGVYVYIAEVEFIDGWIEMYKGDVVLVK